MASSKQVREHAEQIATALSATIEGRQVDHAPMPLLTTISRISRALAGRAQLTDTELETLNQQAEAALVELREWMDGSQEENGVDEDTAPSPEDFARFDPEQAQLVLDDESFNAEAAFDEFLRTGKTERRCLRCGGLFSFTNRPSGYQIKCQSCDYRRTVRGI